MSDAQQKTSEDPGITYIMIGNKADMDEFDGTLGEAKMFGARHAIPEELQFRVSTQQENSTTLQEILKTVAHRLYANQMKTEPAADQVVLSVSLTNPPPENKKNQCSKC